MCLCREYRCHYSPWRPQIININYYEDVDKSTSFYQIQSANPLPENLLELMAFSNEPKQLLPYRPSKSQNWAAGEMSGFPQPLLSVVGKTQSDDGRALDLVLSSPRQGQTLGLLLPGSSGLIKMTIDGQGFTPQAITKGPLAGSYIIILGGIYDRVVNLQLVFESKEPVSVYYYDISTQLPEEGVVLVKSRSPLGSAAHSGDQSLLFRNIDL